VRKNNLTRLWGAGSADFVTKGHKNSAPNKGKKRGTPEKWGKRQRAETCNSEKKGKSDHGALKVPMSEKNEGRGRKGLEGEPDKKLKEDKISVCKKRKGVKKKTSPSIQKKHTTGFVVSRRKPWEKD